MIYIETGSDNVYYNFGLEYYFAVEKQLKDTVFLFWRTTPTLMVGKYQNVLEEINKPYADEHGISIVRRMSGGGTIFTDLGGWQYTFISRKDTKDISFHEYIAPVIDALKELGVSAEFNGRNDLTIDGKKFSGTAQYKIGDSLVHHGSLLFDTDIEQMVASTTVDDYKILSKSIKSVRDRVTNIAEHMEEKIDADTFKECMVRHIMHNSSNQYIPDERDIERIKELAAEKFESWDMIYGANPRFNIERTGRYEGGKIQFKIDVRKNRIEDISVYGDFFSAVDSHKIFEPLKGCRYDRASVAEALYKNGLDKAIYRITAEEIAKTIAD